ncbi:MAG: PleD family two-component system response regulator [Candidatus Hermodarchaeota archaeon]
MKPLILIVEDNIDLLYAIKLNLESNNFKVITAKNGKNALNILSNLDQVPEIIISDIMMPEMNGYEFFTEVSKIPKVNQIPFIFLTAKSSPEDIRFGKTLGVDDYLTKPFNEKDLLAVISGKIKRNKKVKSITEKMDIFLSSFDVEIVPSILPDETEKIIIILMFWDDKYGPKLINHYPKSSNLSFQEIGTQLFQATLFIYGHGKITNAEGILLNLENIKMSGYAYFNSYPDENERYGQKQYMLATIAPNINYFHSLKIKELFNLVSNEINSKKKIDLKRVWKRISDILTASVIPISS